AYEVGGSMPHLLSLGIAALALGFLCGALPPALAATRAEAIVARGSGPLAAVGAVLRFPLLVPARMFARAVLRVARVPEQPTDDPEEITEDILAAVQDSDRGNALAPEEKSWIANIVDIKDLQVSEIMTPRTDMIAVPADQTVAEALHVLIEKGHSRYPV